MTSRQTIFLVARIVLAVGLTVFVISRLQFRDELVFARHGKPPVSGKILSVDETDHTVHFRTSTGTLVVPLADLEQQRPQYGILSLIRRLSRKQFVLSFLCLFGTYVITTARWRMICRCRGIAMAFWHALRLTFLGLFFNNTVPGATGGDVMRAYIAAKNQPSKADIVASVFLDRIIGLVALVMLAGAVLLVYARDMRFRALAANVMLVLVVVAAGTVIYYSRRLRKIFGLNLLGRQLPFRNLIQKMDRAIFLYRYHKRVVLVAFLISFLAHGFTILSHVLIGIALNLDIPIIVYFAFIPIGQVASALPIVPGGWGVREASYGYLFSMAGYPFEFGTAISIIHGLSVLAWSLVGGVLFMTGHDRIPSGALEEMIEGNAPDPAESM